MFNLFFQHFLFLISFVFSVVVYKPDQIQKMEESNRIRKDYKPAELMKLV